MGAWGGDWVPAALTIGGGIAGGAMGGAAGAGVGMAAGGLVGGLIYGDQERMWNEQQMAKQMAAQREFQQMGIQWRVEDAKAAGISPLAALGATGANYSPMQVGENPYTAKRNQAYDMGQNISRAIGSTQTEEERQLTQMQAESQYEDIKGKKLDNEMRALELRRATNPSVPSTTNKRALQGQGSPAQRGIETVPINSKGFAKIGEGRIPTLSEDLKNRIEDTPREAIYDIGDLIGNNIKPHSKNYMPTEKPRMGTHWEWNYPTQKYIQMPDRYGTFERIGKHYSHAWE